MPSTYAGHYTDPPRDSSGRPIPNATFQLFVPGGQVAPTYYTDRVKTTTIPGNPTSDEFGNVDIWPEPGVYEYWYNGTFIQLVTVAEDNGEDDAALTAFQNTVNQALANISVGAAYAPGGTADDTEALQDYIDGLASGGECLFQPGLTYTISQIIKFRDDLSYRAPGNSHGESAAKIKQKAGTNLQAPSPSDNPLAALFVPYGWYNGDDFTGNPTIFENIQFDVNVAQNPSTTLAGLLTMNFWTWVRRCFFTGADGNGYGLILADQAADGDLLTNSSSEPHLYENRFDGCKGLYVQNSGTEANLDGVLFDNKFTNIWDTPIKLDRSAGWDISKNHIYAGGHSGDAISLGVCFATVVSENYIEDFGGKGVSDEYYTGIGGRVLDGWGLRVIGNQIASSEIAGTHNHWIDISSGADQANAIALVADNMLICANADDESIGIVLQNTVGGVLHYAKGNNACYGFGSGKSEFIDSGVLALAAH